MALGLPGAISIRAGLTSRCQLVHAGHMNNNDMHILRDGPDAQDVIDVDLRTLPVGTRKRSPKGAELVLTADNDETPWLCYHKGGDHGIGGWLTDAEVATWEIITDAARAELARRGESR